MRVPLRWLILPLVLLVPWTASAQGPDPVISDTISSNGDTVTLLNLPSNRGSASIVVSNYCSCTLVVEGRGTPGGDWEAIEGAPDLDADGVYNVTVAGLDAVRVRASAWASTTTTIVIRASSAGGGSGGSAQITGEVMVDIEGFSTEAKQDTIIGHVDGVEAALGTIDGRVDGLEALVGTTNSTLTTIDGRVDGIEGLLGTSNTNTGNAATSLGSIDNPVGSATGGSAGSSSFLAGGVYNSTPPTLTNGQQASLQFDENGNLKTALVGSIEADLMVGAQPVDDPHYVRITDGSAAVDIGDILNSIDENTGEVAEAFGSLAPSAIAGQSYTTAPDLTPLACRAQDIDGSALDSVQDENEFADIICGLSGQLLITLVNEGGTTDLGAAINTSLGSILTAAQLIDNAVGTVAAGTAGTGSLLAGGVYNSGGITLTNGQQAALQFNSAGALLVSGSAGGTALADDADFTAGTTSFTPSGGFYQSSVTACTDGDTCAFGITSGRAIKAHLTDAAGASLTPATDKAEDAASANGDTGPVVFAIRDDTLDARSGTEGDFEYFHTNANGALWTIDVNSAAGLTALQLIDNAVFVDDAAFTPGTSSGFIVGGQADDTSTDSVNEGDFGAFRISLDRLLYTRTIDPCSGVAKTHIPINISTATTTEITSALAGASTNYYICSINLVTAGANNVALVDDDTDNCASVTSGLAGGTTAASGWNFAANGGLAYGNGNSTVFKTNGANRVVCLVTSAAVQLSGSMQVVAAP